MPKFNRPMTIFTVIILCALVIDAFSPKMEPLSEYAISKLVTIDEPKMSPSGKFVLSMKPGEFDGVKGFWISVVSIDNADEELIKDEFYRFRDTSFLFWEDNDIIWFYNGDLGTFFWIYEKGMWIKKSFIKNEAKVEVPSLLEELRPNSFGE